ncbi:MAG: hypothetical protein JNM17_18215 [Archangium sp.]|nr:hypothetical protein [Archangium sp.]
MWATLITVVLASAIDDAQALESNGDDRGATVLLEKAVFADPRWAIGRVELGRMQLKLGETEYAWLHLDIARTLAPENPRAHYLYALASDELGHRRDARAALELALSLRDGYADAQVRLASVLFAEADFAGAAATLKPYVAKHPEANGARLQLADALERSGDKKGAEHELRSLLSHPTLKQLAGRRLVALLDSEGKHAESEKIKALIDPPKRQLRDLKPSRK